MGTNHGPAAVYSCGVHGPHKGPMCPGCYATPLPRFEYACPDIDQGMDDSDMVFAEETPLPEMMLAALNCCEAHGPHSSEQCPDCSMPDMVNHPPHYNAAGIEAIDVIEAYAPNNYHRGNALKYLLRADYKGHQLQDLRKALWYVEREIKYIESAH